MNASIFERLGRQLFFGLILINEINRRTGFDKALAGPILIR